MSCSNFKDYMNEPVAVRHDCGREEVGILQSRESWRTVVEWRLVERCAHRSWAGWHQQDPGAMKRWTRVVRDSQIISPLLSPPSDAGLMNATQIHYRNTAERTWSRFFVNRHTSVGMSGSSPGATHARNVGPDLPGGPAARHCLNLATDYFPTCFPPPSA